MYEGKGRSNGYKTHEIRESEQMRQLQVRRAYITCIYHTIQVMVSMTWQLYRVLFICFSSLIFDGLLSRGGGLALGSRSG